MNRRTRIVVLAGLLAALLMAGGVSFYASASPDGLNRVATDQGLDRGEKEHALDDGPLAGYSLKGVGNERASGGMAGIAGVALTFLIGSTLVLAVRRRGANTHTTDDRPDEVTGGETANT